MMPNGITQCTVEREADTLGHSQKIAHKAGLAKNTSQARRLMKTSSNTPWIATTLIGLSVFAAAFFGGEKKAEAVSGDWGIVKQAYLYDDCIYVVFASNQLDIAITGVGVRSQFYDSSNNSLGIWNLTGEAYIESFQTDVVGWHIPSICKSIDTARIIKSVAAY
jgi:hypothetical protein